MLFDFPDRGSRDLQHNTYESLHSDLISIRFQQGRPIHGIRGAASILDLLHIGILHEPYPSLFILVSLRALLTWRSHIHCPLFASSPTQLTIRPQHGQNSWLLSLIPRIWNSRLKLQVGSHATPAHSISFWQPGDDTRHQIIPLGSYVLSLWNKSYNQKQ